MYIPFFERQVDCLEKIASIRNNWLDPFFLFLDYFDSPYFPMVLIPAVWIGISPKWGLRVAILTVVSSLLNDQLKHLFEQPRPIVDFPELAMLPFDTPGFPSGAAQTAMLMGGLLVYSWKNSWAWIIAIPYVFLISFSRLYLGVHYPTDILGGYLFALLILLAYIQSVKQIEKFCRSQGRGFCILGCATVCFLYSFFLANAFGLRLMGAFMGLTLGYYLSLRFDLYPKNLLAPWKRIQNAVFTISVALGLYLAMPHSIPQPVVSFVIAIWVSALAIPACRFLLHKNLT